MARWITYRKYLVLFALSYCGKVLENRTAFFLFKEWAAQTVFHWKSLRKEPGSSLCYAKEESIENLKCLKTRIYCFTSFKTKTGNPKISTFQNKAKPYNMIQLQADQILPQELCLRKGREKYYWYGAFAPSFYLKKTPDFSNWFDLLLSFSFISLNTLRKKIGKKSGS